MEQRPLLHLGVVAIEKGIFGSPSTKIANFTLLIVHLKILKYYDSRLPLTSSGSMCVWRNGRFGKSDKMRKISVKVDKPKHRQRIQPYILFTQPLRSGRI